MKSIESIAELKEIIPADWLEQHQAEFIEMDEKITYSVIMIRKKEIGWEGELKTPEDFDAFFQAESERLGLDVEQVKFYLHQIGQMKAKEMIFDKHYTSLLPKDEQGRPMVKRELVADFIGTTAKPAFVRAGR